MNIDRIVKLIKNGNRSKYLYHFTDRRNIPSIGAHGILSRAEMARRGLEGAICGGNEWSHDQDERMGVSDDVHLCFFAKHPMEYLAKKDERIGETHFIRIKPEVLMRDGVRFCAGVANAKDANLFDAEEFEQHMDIEVMFRRTNWRDPEIQARLQKVEKYEILVPKRVPKTYLLA